MPLFNKRTYVRRAIESIQKQTFHNWELIIVDDGSTDGSSEEVPKSNGRIRLYNQSNAGPSHARNSGIKIARGEFVTFIDADDYYYPFKLEQEMDLLSDKQLAEWMFSAGNFETQSGSKPVKIYKLNNDEIPKQLKIYRNAIKQLRIANWPIDGIFIRKSLLERLNGFKENMRCYEITEFLFRCALAEPSLLINPVPLYSVIDAPASAFKESPYRTEGTRILGESLFKLSKKHPEYANFLRTKSRDAILDYIARLILSGKRHLYQKYLKKKFPYKKNFRWCKLYCASKLPYILVKRINKELNFLQHD